MQNIRLAEAPSHGKTVFQHDWSSTGAQAYQQATKELLERTGKTKTIKVTKSNEPTAKKRTTRKRR
jgi:chromosome partitioning protein